MNTADNLDILVIGAHPDDAEIGCGGLIAKAVHEGKRVGVLDMTAGELGTRGTAETRKMEAQQASQILGIAYRENLQLQDGNIQNNEATSLLLIKKLRALKPEIVIATSESDRHPDHYATAEAVERACFFCGVLKFGDPIENADTVFRPRLVMHFIQDRWMKPDIIVDISEFWETKQQSILAYKTQFHDPKSSEPQTYLSQPGFMASLEARALELGKSIGKKYGEGLTCRRMLGVESVTLIL